MRFPKVLLVISAVVSTWILQLQGSPSQDIATDIARADEFYYAARYGDALTLLSSLDEKLSKEGSASDRAKVKMLIGLNQVALGDLPLARSRFVEFCLIDPNAVLDEQQFPPKVIEIFKEAEAECAECRAVCSRAASLVTGENTRDAADLKAAAASCSCPPLSAGSDETRLQLGRELLAQGKYMDALKEFQSLLRVAPENEVLRQAVSMAQSQIDATVQSAVSEWRTLFFSRQFEGAAASYAAIRALENEATGAAREAANHVTARYQSTFQDLMTSWNSACAGNDEVALSTIRDWGRTLDPNLVIQPDLLARMQCAKPPAANR